MSTKSMSLGLAHKMILTLNKAGFTAKMAKKIQQDSELAWKVVKLVSGSNLKLRPLIKTQKFWVNLYKKYFGIEIDPSIIKEKEGKWEIFIPKGLTVGQVFDALPFGKQKYIGGELDTAIPANDRVADKNYIVYVDQNTQADEEFKNKSANDLKKMNHVGITLLERLVLELKYFEETGQHLDVNNLTLCSGSRDADGVVPGVYWGGGELMLDWYGSSHVGPLLRSREVTLP